MIFHNPFSHAFGLDIGDSSLKLVSLQKKWRPCRGVFYDIRDIRQITLAPDCIVSGELLKPELVAEKIKILMHKHEDAPAIKCPWVVADLPVAKTFLKLIRINAPQDEVGEETIRAELSKHLPLDIKEAAIDWQIIENDEDEKATSILIGAAPKKIVNAYSELLILAGLQPLALEIEDLSIARALITASKSYQGEARAILDLGGSRSSIIIYDKGSIQFSSLINFSGDLIDKTLAQKLKIKKEEADSLKNTHGINYIDQYPEYLKIITELADKLVEDIFQILLFYRDHYYQPNPVTHITMSGGVSSMINLSKYLTDNLKTETVPGNVWKNLFNKKDEQDKKGGLAMASAIGLAIRATEWPLGGKK